MVGRDVVTLAALLVEPEPPPALLPEVVLPPHADDRAHPREAVESITETSARSRRPASVPVSIASRSRRASAGESTGVAPFVTTVLRPPDGRRRVHRENLADDDTLPRAHVGSPAPRGDQGRSRATHRTAAARQSAPRRDHSTPDAAARRYENRISGRYYQSRCDFPRADLIRSTESGPNASCHPSGRSLRRYAGGTSALRAHRNASVSM